MMTTHLKLPKMLLLISLMMSVISTNAQMLLPFGSTWKYLDTGSDQDSAWRALTYNDNTWQSGLAPLGYAMTGVLTTVSFGPDAANKYPTTYYRKKVNVTASDLAGFDSLFVTLRIDDGSVLYINGTEVMRPNMPTGTINYSTNANSPAVGSTPAVFTAMLPKSLLNAGENIFAMEIHQQSGTSPDTYFDMLVDPIKNDSVVIDEASTWKYNDQGIAAPSGWTGISFNDSLWPSGNGVLGYGNGDEATILSYGANPANKYITAYFRKKFNLTGTAGYDNLQLLLKRDDGAVVYVNGADVYRNNMLAGSFDHTTKALSPVEGADENAWITINLPASLLISGDNVVAVEVHKFNNMETDLRFDMKISLQQTAKPQAIAAPVVTCNPSSSNTIGCFTSVKPQAQTPGFIIPFTHTFQLIAKQGDANFYSNSASNIPSTHDFTAYLATSGSSREGIVAINHENDPGDVSLVSVHFNDSNKIWAVDSARLVDFAPLVRTSRNCSGGITPWGTVVTSEETYVTGDVNGDGYHDRGWQVEIDPVSGKIIDYDGDGNPDKIWAMGRMSHENIALSADSAIAYQAEDGGTSGVYKYVMTVKGKLDAGTLYVLKHDSPTSTTGTWIQVPNTTQAERNTVSSVITSLGGTNWNGPEDVEFGPDGKMYFTSKGTGTIWRFKDDGTTVSEVEAWVTNTSYPVTHAEGTSNESFGTGIDNLAFDNEGNLWAQQDGGRSHLWVIRPNHTQAIPKVELFAVSPAGSEFTGLTFTPDYKYGFMSVQHPTGSNSTLVQDASGNMVQFNAAVTVIFARKEYLGLNAIEPVFSLGDSITACESAQLVANTSADVLNIWQDNSTGTDLSAASTGWYKATAYANNGRSYTDSAFVTINALPAAPATTNQSVCDGETVPALSAAGSNLVWYSDTALLTQVGSGSIFNTGNTAPGTYTYYSTQTDGNGCTSNFSPAILTINALPPSPVSADQDGCVGKTIPSLSASGTNIKWYSDSALTNQVSMGPVYNTGQTAAGSYTYYATQTSGNGCASVPTSVELTITSIPSSPVITGTMKYCAGDVIQALNANGNNVAWYEDAALTSLVGSGNTYFPFITVTDTFYVTQTMNSCTSPSDTVIVVFNPLPSVNISGLNSSYFVTNAPVTITGTPAGGSFTGPGVSGNQFDPSFAGVGSSHNIVYTYTDSLTGCTNTALAVVAVNFNVGIISFENGNHMQVFPNPAQAKCTLRITLNGNYEVEAKLYDLTGKSVMVQQATQMNAGTHDLLVERAALNLSSGLYWLKVRIGEQQSGIKLIIQ